MPVAKMMCCKFAPKPPPPPIRTNIPAVIVVRDKDGKLKAVVYKNEGGYVVNNIPLF